MNFLKQLWLTYRSNPYVVAAYSAAIGAVASYIQHSRTTGSFSATNLDWGAMASLAAGAALLAVAHLYLTPPGANPK